ncbi:MAG: SpoIIE family protein phosphatase [Actinomycetota bacterium]|nr:SpoIIE family protein phosphatase [Actinomycetota bacterium]
MTSPPELEQLQTARAALEELQAERRRLLDLIVRMPALLAERDPALLVAGVAEACRELTGARFALYVPADPGAAPTLTGSEWGDFADPPDFAQAPLLAGPRLHGQPHLIDDVAAWARDDRATAYGTLADGRLIRSWLVAPVPCGDSELAGVLYLGHPRPHAFTAEQVSLAAGLAQHLGVAIANAELAAERDRVASALEANLLPPVLPRIQGVDLAARYRAAGPSDVGGDFYDAFPLAGGRWAVVVGDVAGSGPDAAAITGVARYSIRAIAPAERRPAAVLARLNDALLRRAADDRFLTAVLAWLEPVEHGVRVELASGGHPPPLVLGDDESVTVVDTGAGTLLGTLATTNLHDTSVFLEPGDALVLYTDGVIEARDEEGRQFGQDGLDALLATCAGRSAAGIARRIELGVLAHTPAVADDMAVVVVRATGRRPGT